MDLQRKKSIPTLNLNFQESSVPEQQGEEKPKNEIIQAQHLQVIPTPILANKAHSISPGIPEKKILKRQDTFFYTFGLPTKIVTTKDLLLGQQDFNILASKICRKVDENIPESLLDLPDSEYDRNLNCVPSEIPTKRGLRTLYRRRSCICHWCGGSSALEKKVQGLLGFPIPDLANRRISMKARTVEQGMVNISMPLGKNKYEGIIKSHEKHSKNAVTLKSLVTQVRNNMSDGISPKLSPNNGNKLKNSPTKAESINKHSYFEFKEEGEEVKLKKESKSSSRKGIDLKNNIKSIPLEKNNSKKEENKNISNQQVKKKLIIKKKGFGGTHLKKHSNVIVKTENLSMTSRDSLPKLFQSSVRQKTYEGYGFDETRDTPIETEKDSYSKTIKRKLKVLTARKSELNEYQTKKVYGAFNVDTGGHLMSPNNHTASEYRVSSNHHRTTSLPMNQALEIFHAARIPTNETEITEQTRLHSKENEKERPSKKRSSKLKFMTKSPISVSSECSTSLGFKSLKFQRNSPLFSNLKYAASARLKCEAKNEWLLKNYTSKIVIKKE